MKHLLFVCQYVEPFQSYVLLIDGDWQNFGVSPPNILGVGEKNF